MPEEPPQSRASRVEIRLAREDDQPHLAELFLQSRLDGQVRDNDTGADLEHLHEGYFADDGASSFWVAEMDGRLVGMVGVQRTQEDESEIRRLRVHENYRRQGVGTALMEKALGFCQRHGYLKVVLDVRTERSPAIALFGKFGFSLSETRDVGGGKMLDFYLDLYRDPNSG